VTDEEIKERTTSFDAKDLFAHAMFGDNTTIVLGSHNTQTVTNTKNIGDFNALAEILRRNGVDENDISDLRKAIASDQESHEISLKKYGPSVQVWLKSMLTKAIDSSWQIEIGVAGSLLASALQKYYGWL
jgi:hypothetical protein